MSLFFLLIIINNNTEQLILSDVENKWGDGNYVLESGCFNVGRKDLSPNLIVPLSGQKLLVQKKFYPQKAFSDYEQSQKQSRNPSSSFNQIERIGSSSSLVEAYCL